MNRTVENNGEFDIEQIESAMVTWHVPPLPTVPGQFNVHRIEAVWKERHPLDGKSQEGGSLHIWMTSATELFGDRGLREILPNDWYFDGRNSMAHNPDTLELTRQAAMEIVELLGQKMREKIASEPVAV